MKENKALKTMVTETQTVLILDPTENYHLLASYEVIVLSSSLMLEYVWPLNLSVLLAIG